MKGTKGAGYGTEEKITAHSRHMGSSDLGPKMNEAVVELPEERKDYLWVYLLVKSGKRLEREGSAAWQNANEAEVILFDTELNVLKGPSRDD